MATSKYRAHKHHNNDTEENESPYTAMENKYENEINKCRRKLWVIDKLAPRITHGLGIMRECR